MFREMQCANEASAESVGEYLQVVQRNAKVQGLSHAAYLQTSLCSRRGSREVHGLT